MVFDHFIFIKPDFHKRQIKHFFIFPEGMLIFMGRYDQNLKFF